MPKQGCCVVRCKDRGVTFSS